VEQQLVLLFLLWRSLSKKAFMGWPAFRAKRGPITEQLQHQPKQDSVRESI